MEKNYPKAKVLGHKDVTQTSKTCPNFDVTSWTKQNKIMKNIYKQVIIPLCDLKIANR